MYWKPHMAAKDRIDRARNMWMIRTTPTISDSATNNGKMFVNVTATILIHSRYHVRHRCHERAIGAWPYRKR
jgi:hypothetical protein